ncbi:aminotransferase class V-fold PLP-dependent enzyme [Winogradskya humida]|uniref:Aminotransferase n=1 Tax=Winogradskya humida TaxID=113566 RepID=A0ABQ4A156_9ACTN|nr:aminotransferase class V-fold PLP-dependent enzyme [Actinoplanes humidus]GIE24567.1 aminotransferase [Actinoplanes humidus]
MLQRDATVAENPGTEPSPSVLRTASWDRIRDLFPLDSGTAHLNSGTVGVMPHDVLDTYTRVTREWTGSLANIYPPSLYPEYRAAIASDFGVAQDEMVICHNATEGMARVVAGLDFRPGDEVLTTTHECFSVLSNLNLAHNRYGVEVHKLTLPTGYDVTTEEILHLFESAITPRTRAMFFAGVTLFGGVRMPVRELCTMAQRRGIITVVDGALLPGMIDTDLRRLGVDFLVGSGSKWQCGPLGTGLLYVRNRVTPANPLPLPTFWPVISTWYPLEGAPPPRSHPDTSATNNIGDYLQSAGSASVARAAALARACEVWNLIGRSRIEERILSLGRYAKRRIAEELGPGALYSPTADERLNSPLTTFNPFRDPADAYDGMKFETLIARLEHEDRVWIRWVEFDVPGSARMRYAARFCTHLFNSEDDVDRALLAVVRLATELS